jgi:hypothetical protein
MLLSQTMKRVGQIIDTTFLFVVILCSPASAQMAGYLSKTANPNSADHVSIVQLIANPERYDGKRVQFIGFLRIEFEGTAVYLHREDYEWGIGKNALWINIPTGMSQHTTGIWDYSAARLRMSSGFNCGQVTPWSTECYRGTNSHGNSC